jgi:hypothetical protein
MCCILFLFWLLNCCLDTSQLEENTDMLTVSTEQERESVVEKLRDVSQTMNIYVSMYHLSRICLILGNCRCRIGCIWMAKRLKQRNFKSAFFWSSGQDEGGVSCAVAWNDVKHSCARVTSHPAHNWAKHLLQRAIFHSSEVVLLNDASSWII